MARRDAHAAMCVQREARQAAPTEPIARRDHGPHGRHHCTARAGAVQCSASSADQRQRSVLDHHQLRCSVRIQAQVIPRPNNRGSQRPAERARGVQCRSRRMKRPVGNGTQAHFTAPGRGAQDRRSAQWRFRSRRRRLSPSVCRFARTRVGLRPGPYSTTTRYWCLVGLIGCGMARTGLGHGPKAGPPQHYDFNSIFHQDPSQKKKTSVKISLE